MNAKQIKAAQTATQKSWIQFKTCKHIYGELSFTMDIIGDSVYIFGSNTETKGAFDEHVMLNIFIGPRGGVTIKVM